MINRDHATDKEIVDDPLSTAQMLMMQARQSSRRAYVFFGVLWITVVVMMSSGLYTLYDYAQHTNRTLACVLSVAPDERGPDLWVVCDRKVP